MSITIEKLSWKGQMKKKVGRVKVMYHFNDELIYILNG